MARDCVATISLIDAMDIGVPRVLAEALDSIKLQSQRLPQLLYVRLIPRLACNDAVKSIPERGSSWYS